MSLYVPDIRSPESDTRFAEVVPILWVVFLRFDGILGSTNIFNFNDIQFMFFSFVLVYSKISQI